MSQVYENGAVKGLKRYKAARNSVIEGHFPHARNTMKNMRKKDGRPLAKSGPQNELTDYGEMW